jgi:hypothetical protein
MIALLIRDEQSDDEGHDDDTDEKGDGHATLQ